MASKNRIESNQWLKIECKKITGKTLSIGSLDDSDGQGGKYREYFCECDQYLTSEIGNNSSVDIKSLDVCNMFNISDDTFDCVFCSGVLEHVVDFKRAITEMHRITKPSGGLLLGVPFNQPIHMHPTDYWRFTKYGVELMLKDYYNIENMIEINNTDKLFPGAYWVRGIKR